MPNAGFVLILTPDESAGERLRETLRSETEHSCRVVTEMSEALDSIGHRAPDVVLVEADASGFDLELLATTLDRQAPESVLLVVAADTPTPTARKIDIRLVPPQDEPSKLVGPVNRAAERAVRAREDRLMRASFDSRRAEAFEGIIGEAAPMRLIIERIKKAARNKLTVLILGETGTGKDLIAEAIHNRSDRSGKPLLPLNCAGLNENLLESHLFGHVKGAFTGATSDRKGYFEAAHGGTLFLDEIGDMPLTMQAKLLRALERREITPVGSTDVRRVDVRVIAATNVDLQNRVQERAFREDLYYRLNQWVIRVPPLRERREDIPLLALHMLRRAHETHGVQTPGIAPDAMEALTKYMWPGNVRELANVIESVAVELEGRTIEHEDLPERIRGPRDLVPVSSGMVGLTMAQVERMMIERTLQATEGNREQAAKMLDIGTRTLYRKIKEYGLS